MYVIYGMYGCIGRLQQQQPQQVSAKVNLDRPANKVSLGRVWWPVHQIVCAMCVTTTHTTIVVAGHR